MRSRIVMLSAAVLAGLVCGACSSPDSADGGAVIDAAPRDGGASCALICEAAVACGAPVERGACVDQCESSAPALRACLTGCPTGACDALTHCSTVCGRSGGTEPTSPYGACPGEGADGPVGSLPCSPDAYLCLALGNTTSRIGSVCLRACDAATPCPAPSSGTAVPRCDEDLDPGVCVLDCAEGRRCPDGMTCAVEGEICFWAHSSP